MLEDNEDENDVVLVRWWEKGLNARKILERVISAVIAGTVMAVVFFGLGECL